MIEATVGVVSSGKYFARQIREPKVNRPSIPARYSYRNADGGMDLFILLDYSLDYRNESNSFCRSHVNVFVENIRIPNNLLKP